MLLGLLSLLGALLPGAAAAQSPGGAEAGASKPAKEEPPAPSGHSAPAGPQDAHDHAGPAPTGPAPRLARLRCRTRCFGRASARPGGLLDLRGRAIAGVAEVVFLGDPADAADDVTVLPRRVTKKRILVRVPPFARTGRVLVADGDGAQSAPTRGVLKVGAAPAAASGGRVAVDVQVQSPRVFIDGVRAATLTYALRAAQAATVDVELVRAADGGVVASWPQGLVEPGASRTLTWDGTVAGSPAAPGRYQFRVLARDGSGATASSAQAGTAPAATPDAFELLDHQFPVRGPHGYGEYAASFGGGRGHQGHDVFAACGTPLVAARGGKVRVKQYHSAAGNYLIVDGEQTGVDYAYMHLRDAALVKVGDRVRTGQLLGYVGETGRASGCHLHFEMWSAPGWYEGGAPFDPLPHLRAWDRTS